MGEEVLPHPLREIRTGDIAGQDAALGIRADDRDRTVLRLQEAGDPGYRAAGSGTGDQVRDPALGLLPDLGARGPFVGRRVLHVPVLVRLVCARDVAREAGRHGVIGLGRFRLHVGRAEHDVRAVCPQQGLLLGRLLVRHHEDAAIALEHRRDRQAVAGVAGCRLDYRSAGLQEPGSLCCLDHRQPDPVLHRTAGIHGLELAEDQRLCLNRTEIARDAGEPDERRPADEIEDGLGVLHGRTG